MRRKPENAFFCIVTHRFTQVNAEQIREHMLEWMTIDSHRRNRACPLVVNLVNASIQRRVVDQSVRVVEPKLVRQANNRQIANNLQGMVIYPFLLLHLQHS